MWHESISGSTQILIPSIGYTNAFNHIRLFESRKNKEFKIGQPPDVLPLIQHISDRKQEHFLCVSLNGAYEVIAVRTVLVGLVNKLQVHLREVFADPLTDRATAVIVAHNHPTGNLTPSKDDIAITRQLKSAGETLGIRLLDHIIFSHKGYYSFLEHGGLE